MARECRIVHQPDRRTEVVMPYPRHRRPARMPRVPLGIRDGQGVVLGAVGISGDVSDKDEAWALAGIEAARLTGDTG